MIKRKIFGLTILSAMLITFLFGNFNVAYAADDIGLEAESAILLEASTGKILYEKNADVTLPPASMTKMMTEYLILEAVKKGQITWDQEVTISDYAHRISQNRVYQMYHYVLIIHTR